VDSENGSSDQVKVSGKHGHPTRPPGHNQGRLIMKRSPMMTRDELDQLVASMQVSGFSSLSEGELFRVEGGRARLSAPMDDGTRALPTGEVQVRIPTT
jgi:hypothetical protein